jgi:ATP/maltotriose-dependent transcriptional regulator MalT
MFDGAEIFPRVTDLLTREYGFHMSWIGESSEAGALIRHTSGNRTERFRGTLLRKGCGLGGKVFASGRVQWVDDYFASAEITHDYDEYVAAEQVQRMVAAPIIAGERNFGVLLCGHRDSGSCGGRSVAIVEAVAERCARALSSAERALRLHDTLGSMLLDIEAAARALGESSPHERLRKDRLQTLERQAKDASALLGEWRRTLRGLRDPALDPAHDRQDAGGFIARRERDVLRRVATGETNHEIAGAMSLSHNTVKTYLRNAMTKLGARNRVEAITRAREMGLL